MKLSKKLLLGCLIYSCALIACGDGNGNDNKKADTNSSGSSKVDTQNNQSAVSPAVMDDEQSVQLEGAIDDSPEWGSGWMVLNPTKIFHRGDTLNIRIGGTAGKVFIRLLPENGNPNSKAGIEGGVRNVNSDKKIQVVLAADRLNIEQISVHGKDAWGIIGGENGPATLISVIYKRHK